MLLGSTWSELYRTGRVICEFADLLLNALHEETALIELSAPGWFISAFVIKKFKFILWPIRVASGS